MVSFGSCVVTVNQAWRLPMVTFAFASPKCESCDVTLIAILSPLATVVREPLTSAPFFTSVQPALGVSTSGVSNRSNRQKANDAVTEAPSPATVTSLLVMTALGATPVREGKENKSGVTSASVSVTLDGADTPLPPETDPETVTNLSASAKARTAVIVTLPELVVSPAWILRVWPDKVKSAATAPVPAAAPTVTSTPALDGCVSVAVTVDTP